MRIIPPAIHSPHSPFVYHSKYAPNVLSRRLAMDSREQLFHEEFFPPNTDELVSIFDVEKSGKLRLLPDSDVLDANELEDLPHDGSEINVRFKPSALLDAKTYSFLTHYHEINMEMDRLPSRRQVHVL